MVHPDQAENSWVELTNPPGGNELPRKVLIHGSVLTRASVPVPADGRDRVVLQMAAKRAWRYEGLGCCRAPLLLRFE
ncbi:hypothetical protein AB0890_35715 [Streptomyces sp. NPDC005406]|uniref:hypothetical protein n=1 Tax=Streptomyces sp. NPDC005406 TaxID=3155339 RepID=UPI003455FDF1